MLRINNLVSGYIETTVINGVSLDMKEGEIIGIIGRNGVGKTTLIKTIMGLKKCREGEILFEGKNISSLPSYMRASMGMAYVPQGRMIFPRLSVLDNLRAGGVALKKDLKLKVEEVLEEFPILKEKLRSRGDSLSGGQQQILAVARALMSSPKLMLLDEPNEGVQPSIVEQILNKIRDINNRGLSVILVEQSLEFVSELASKIYIIDKGIVAKQVSPTELLEDKQLQHEYLGV